MPSVSAVIVNFNGADVIEDCLDSLFAQSRAPDEVIIVDNASSDSSLEIIRERYRERVRLLTLDFNAGFPAACNRGIEASSGELVAILNNDIVLDREWLASLLAHDTDEWSFWASRIVFASAPDRIDSAGDGMAVVGAAYKIGHGDPAGGHEESKEVFGPCAAAALYRRRLLQETGGFDEDFFLVYEDADLNMRARLLGYRCLYVAGARVTHRVNTQIGTLSHSYVFYGHRNSEFVFWKNMPGRLFWLYLPERLLFNLFSLLFFTLKGRGLSFLRGKWDFARQLSLLLAKRRLVQRGRRLTTAQFRRQLDRNWLRYRLNYARPE